MREVEDTEMYTHLSNTEVNSVENETSAPSSRPYHTQSQRLSLSTLLVLINFYRTR